MRKVGSFKRLAAGAAAVSALTAIALFASALATASHVEPVPGPDNAQASDCPAGSTGWKYQPVATAIDVGDGVLSVSVTVNDTTAGPTVDWGSSNLPIVTLFVKGGDGSNKYVYAPAVTGDSGNHAPANPNGKWAGLSHLVFCYTPPPPTGSLTVIKHVINDDDGDAESDDWTMNVDGPSSSSFLGVDDPGTTKTVNVGDYKVTESGGPAGYTLTYSGDCDENGNVIVGAKETKTCTLTNDDDEGPPPPKKGTITVEKQTIPDGYEPPQGGFDFTGAITAVLNDGETSDPVEVEPGTHTVIEDLEGRPFWDVISIECDDDDSSGDPQTMTATYEVDPGETVNCVFTNQKRSLLIVEKRTSPVGAGGDQVFAFDASYGDFSLTEGKDHGVPLPAGAYSVNEIVPEGWELESATCDNGDEPDTIDLPADTVVTCTFVNSPAPEPANIVVSKETNPNDDPTSFGFTASYDADGFSLTDGQSNDSGDLDPGTYSVSETATQGWELESAVCSDQSDPSSISLQAGETVTCTFTNEKDSRIIVSKETDPNDDPTSFGFTASYDADGFSLTDGQSNDSGDLDPGTYSVSETATQGWELESAVCSDQSDPSSISLQAGETVTCTFTNEKDSRIIVSKETDPDDDPTSFGFTASYDADGFSLSDGESNDSGDLDPGTYSVSENIPAGWALSSVVCTGEQASGAIELAAGETVTCTFTNTKLGSVTIVKETDPDDAQVEFPFTFEDDDFTLAGGESETFDGLLPGTYQALEGTLPAGWSLESASCDDESAPAEIELSAGEEVTCTFLNSQNPVITAAKGSISVSKSASPTSVKEPGGPVTFSVTITNTSTVLVTITSVVDDKFGDLDDDGGNGCFDVPINMGPGAKANCTFQRTITGTGGTSHVNTVTASGADASGNKVSGSDDARVDITPRLIDLVVVKEATSPTPLNGIVNYSLTVTNKGPDTATNVVLADPAPSGITYLTANPSQGMCGVEPTMIMCNLGSIAPGQTVTIAIRGRATTVGSHTNTATVSGGGGRETNPADNVDTAVTVVPAPLKPPTVEPTPAPAVCLALTVSPKMIKADGKVDKVTAKVTAGKKRMKGVKVSVRGAGVAKTARTNGKGVAVLRINPRKPGIVTITVVESNQKLCGAKRIGVVGVFLPPLTG